MKNRTLYLLGFIFLIIHNLFAITCSLISVVLFPITIILYIIFGINLIHFFLFEMIDEDKEYFYDKLIDKDF